MNNHDINVIARLTVKKGMVGEALELLKDLQNATRNESGCQMYQLHQSIEDETVFVLYESWTDKNSLDNHFQSPHFTRWLAREKNYMAAPAEVIILRKIN